MKRNMNIQVCCKMGNHHRRCREIVYLKSSITKVIKSFPESFVSPSSASCQWCLQQNRTHSSHVSGETSGGISSGSSFRCFASAFASEVWNLESLSQMMLDFELICLLAKRKLYFKLSRTIIRNMRIIVLSLLVWLFKQWTMHKFSQTNRMFLFCQYEPNRYTARVIGYNSKIFIWNCLTEAEKAPQVQNSWTCKQNLWI